jgi:hypothetical protein
MSNLYHLLVFVAVFVACSVLLPLVFIKTKKFKMYIDVDPKLAIAYGLSEFVAAKNIRFQVMAECLTHKINPDWARAVTAALGARKIPISLEVFGRQITCVIDARDNFVSENIGTVSNIRLEGDSAPTTNLTCSEFEVKIVSLTHKPDLNAANPMRDISHCQRGNHASCEP